MNKKFSWIILGCLTFLPGCATLSFAPPPVALNQTATTTGNKICSTNLAGSIRPDVQGALALTDNFIYAYRCAASQAGNGRQAFEIPSFLAAVAGIAAPVLGAGENVAVALGIGAATLNGGKNYWVPQQKSALIDSALDALICIKSESVGVKFFDTTQPPPPSIKPTEKSTGLEAFLSKPADDKTPQISEIKRYSIMVTSALFSVERILAQRLRSVGNADPAGVIAEISALKKQAETAEMVEQNALNKMTMPPEKSDVKDDGTLLSNKIETTKNDTVKAVRDLELDKIQPRLQLCVVRAKL